MVLLMVVFCIIFEFTNGINYIFPINDFEKMHREISQQWKREIKERIVRELQQYSTYSNDTYIKQIIRVKVKPLNNDQKARRVFHSIHRRIKHSAVSNNTCFAGTDCSEPIEIIIKRAKDYRFFSNALIHVSAMFTMRLGLYTFLAALNVSIKMTLQEINIHDEKVKREIIEKCREYDDYEERRIHCQIQELKKMQIKDVILSHVGNVDVGSVSRMNHERIVKEIERKRKILETQNCHTRNCSKDSTINSIVIKAAKFAPAHLPVEENRIWFNLSQMSKHEFDSASVLFYVGRVRQKASNKHYKVNFYRYISPTEIAEQFTPFTREQEVQSIRTNDDGNWHHIDITNILREWLTDEASNYGIMIKITVRDADGDEIYTENVAKSEKPAFLELNSAKVRAHAKRSLSTIEPETCRPEALNANTNCCLYPLEISFDEFGWDWVVAPKKIKFYYCAGKCDKSTLKKVDHARLLSHDSLSDMCCSPEKIEPLEIIYQDAQSNLQVREIPNMVVRSCACS